VFSGPDDERGFVEGWKPVFIGGHEVNKPHQCWLGFDVRTHATSSPILLDEPRVILRLSVNSLNCYTIRPSQVKLTINPLTPTVAIWVQLHSILCRAGLSRQL